jgi:hypothetical protein
MKNLESFTDNDDKIKRHSHWGIMHTNGVLECLQCGKFVMKKQKAHAYQGKAYEGKIIIKEGNDEGN